MCQMFTSYEKDFVVKCVKSEEALFRKSLPFVFSLARASNIHVVNCIEPFCFLIQTGNIQCFFLSGFSAFELLDC